jgi:dethiobiotin synthetase
MTKKIIVVGIGTEVGKTIVSATLVEALRADYWKPIQSGSEAQTDTQTVKSLTTFLPERTFYPEAYSLKAPLSPHAAAELENVTIDTSTIILPTTDRNLVVELAGGLLVPITYRFLNIHLIQQLALPVVVVANYYLGSINHTLLTIEVLRTYQIPVLGIIFNGACVPASQKVILEYTNLPLLGEIPQLENISPETIAQASKLINC